MEDSLGETSPTISSVELLGVRGPIAKRIEDYEERPQQMAMARAVEYAFDVGKHLIVEAGTGVGKSFAYLLPAILKATSGGENARPVVISTHTIALQQQLMEKDIPFLRSVTGLEFSSVMVKGRNNYLSRRRLELALTRTKQNQLFEDSQQRHLELLEVWAAEHEDGSTQNLQFEPNREVWGEVVSDKDNCLGKSCPFYESCFYQRARRRMYNADILVVNHALFFSDLSLRRMGAKLLPDYQYVVIDEAHGLEDMASKHFGLDIGYFGVLSSFGKLINKRRKRGLLVTYPHLTEKLLAVIDQARLQADLFFSHVDAEFPNHQQTSLRLHRNPRWPRDFVESAREIQMLLKEGAASSRSEEDQLEIMAQSHAFGGLAAGIESFFAIEDQGADVHWIARGEGANRNIFLRSAPIHVGNTLREVLFDRVRSVVMSSATLSTGVAGRNGGGPFSYLRDRLGLAPASPVEALTEGNLIRGFLPDDSDEDPDASGCFEVQLGSPFNYADQVELVLPQLPDPRERDFLPLAAKKIVRYVQRSSGGTMVLFTSYRDMQAMKKQIHEELTFLGFPMIMQGEGTERTRMLDLFREGKFKVLFGTESFWQGVDVPGEALSTVIICKLPFPVPTEPLAEARAEEIKRRGGSDFAELSLPQAIIKLKQGFGRLIRRSSDSGRVVILDSRLLTKGYGRRVLSALPPARRVNDE